MTHAQPQKKSVFNMNVDLMHGPISVSYTHLNINRLTLKAGQAALEDTAYFDRTRAAIVNTRAWTKQQLEQRGFAVLDSRSNFLFASTDRKDGKTLYKELKKNGILVRHFDAPRIQRCV